MARIILKYGDGDWVDATGNSPFTSYCLGKFMDIKIKMAEEEAKELQTRLNKLRGCIHKMKKMRMINKGKGSGRLSDAHRGCRDPRPTTAAI